MVNPKDSRPLNRRELDLIDQALAKYGGKKPFEYELKKLTGIVWTSIWRWRRVISNRPLHMRTGLRR